MSNKFEDMISIINPMDNAPTWGYYNGNVDVIELFYRMESYPAIISCIAYFNRTTMHWHLYYNNSVIREELVGWLPRREYVSIN
jgi:hypothetical protein